MKTLLAQAQKIQWSSMFSSGTMVAHILWIAASTLSRRRAWRCLGKSRSRHLGVPTSLVSPQAEAQGRCFILGDFLPAEELSEESGLCGHQASPFCDDRPGDGPVQILWHGIEHSVFEDHGNPLASAPSTI